MPPAHVHFLDVGEREYGDAVLCQLGGTTVLIDGAHPGDQIGGGGHPGIPEQLKALLETRAEPVHVDLLIVTHAHQDHIGCLPHLVAHGLLAADWALVADPGLGWGRTPGDDAASGVDARVRNVVAALREEPPSPEADDRALAQVIADAVSLEQSYTGMLRTLADAGTRVVRFGRDDPAALLEAFAGVGLEILGPSEAQLLLCADTIAERTQDAVGAVSDALVRTDAAAETDTALFRSLLRSAADGADATSRPGPAINLQSIVTAFRFGDVKLLFAGDMQFADPQIANAQLEGEVGALRERIRAAAPFSLVKLSHHGSDNAFDAELLAELGATPLFGICAGEDSMSHPNPRVLRLLDAERDRLRWVRTDHNGLSTVTFDGQITVTPAHGELNDARPNTPDVQPAPPAVRAPAVRAPAVIEVSSEAAVRHEPVEVITRIPMGVDRVVVSIEVGRGRAPRIPVDAPGLDAFALAGGRTLPRLLFVTNRAALAGNVGAAEADGVLRAIADAGQSLYELPDAATDAAAALACVRGELATRDGVRGVVLVGGYDVVPSQQRDCLPAALRAALGTTEDPDGFIVWSDDGYGERDGGQPVAVSRVPDGRSADLLATALAAGDASRGPTRRGVRNVARPFAEEIFRQLHGPDALLVSQPTTHDVAPALDADLVYIMLHGDYLDASRFWGEDTVDNVEAVNLTNIPAPGARVVFTGCCWGALTVDQPAQRAMPGTAPAPKAPNASIALRFLETGATAFVGCTGAHYSPTEPPYGYFGGPMHEEFWRALANGAPPAEALLTAKAEYVRGFPHGRRSEAQQAIEYKILNQYTCLGLGW
jgi:beta-lactamase superfamily II metal-dependent hydrolase